MQSPGNIKPGGGINCLFLVLISFKRHTKCLPAIRSTPGCEERQNCWVVNMIIVLQWIFEGGRSLDESIGGQRKGVGAR